MITNSGHMLLCISDVARHTIGPSLGFAHALVILASMESKPENS